ncbi:MAG TPA: diguanylate cyclase, partial [Gammaproteobacteria bacterium]
GQIHVDEGLFTFSTIYPIELIGGYSKEEVENEHIGHHHQDPKAYAWRIISDIPNNVLYQHVYDHIFGMLGVIWVFLIIVGAYASMIACRSYTERSSLRLMRELHAKIYNTTTDGILITDSDSNIIAANSAFTDITGYSEQEVIGKKPSILSSGMHDRDFYQRMWAAIQKDGVWVGEVINRHKNNNNYHEWLRISAVKDESGKIINYVAMISDITEKKELESRLKTLAHRDTLTGLRNRYAFEEDIKKIILHAQTHNTKFALLYLDLDKFKPINDQYGHTAGDAVLQIVARRLMNQVRGMDKVARIGGDEFTVILNHIEKRENADKIAAAITESIEQPMHYKDNTFSISASIGVVIFPDDADNLDTLISRADKAMYTVKLQRHPEFSKAGS